MSAAVEVQDDPLAAAADGLDPGAGQGRGPGDAPRLAEGVPGQPSGGGEAATGQGGPQVADDRLDFRQLGHDTPRSAWIIRQAPPAHHTGSRASAPAGRFAFPPARRYPLPPNRPAVWRVTEETHACEGWHGSVPWACC